MDIAHAIGQYLQDSEFGTLGTDIFVGHMPSDTNGIYIMRTSGDLERYVPIETPVVDIYYKHQKAETAIDQLEKIKRNVHRMHSSTPGDAYIYSMLVIGDIEDIERDLEYHKIFKISVQVMFRDTNLIS